MRSPTKMLLLPSLVVLVIWLGSGLAGFDQLMRLYAPGAAHWGRFDLPPRDQSRWSLPNGCANWPHGDDAPGKRPGRPDCDDSEDDSREERNESRDQGLARAAEKADKKVPKWTPPALVKELVAKMEALIAQYYPGARLKIEDVKVKRKGSAVIILATGEFKWNRTEYELAFLVLITEGNYALVSLAGEDVDLRYWWDMKKKTGAVMTDLTFMVEGSLNLAGLSTQWQQSTVTSSFSFLTGGLASTNYLNTQGTGAMSLTVVSTADITGNIQVVIVPRSY